MLEVGGRGKADVGEELLVGGKESILHVRGRVVVEDELAAGIGGDDPEDGLAVVAPLD